MNTFIKTCELGQLAALNLSGSLVTAVRDTSAVLTARDVSPSTQQWRMPRRKLFRAAGETICQRTNIIQDVFSIVKQLFRLHLTKFDVK